jgi:hypothetical protein
MQLFNIFSALSSQYLNKYLNRAQDGVSKLPPGLNRELLPGTAANPERSGLAKKINDAYIPSDSTPDQPSVPIYTKPETVTDQPVEAGTTKPDSDITTPKAADKTTDESADTTPAVATPVTISRQAELGYNLTLQFDLAAFTRTIEKMADGGLTQTDQLAMASFGLSTEFSLSGKEVINLDSGQAVDQNGHAVARQSLKQRQANMFAAQSRDFQAFSFQREATDVRQMVEIKFKDNARRAVNKFALRYRSDSQFSFSFAQRLNVQTKQVSAEAPDSVGKYLDSAGEVAVSGTDQMMAAFFDAVEGYLAANKEQTAASVSAFFNEAATALGFSGTDMANYASANLTDTIDNFFERVSAAVADLRTLYLGESTGASPTATDLAEIPADYATPEPIPVNMTADRSLAAERQQAVA